jgi:glutaredoxin
MNALYFVFRIFVILAACSTTLADLLADNPAEKKVVMFSATFCPNCLHAKDYLSSQNIPYIEFDIEKSQAAREYFDKLGGRGTPFMLINNQAMQGFNKNRFWQYYNRE